jgi:hypothetical protein
VAGLPLSHLAPTNPSRNPNTHHQTQPLSILVSSRSPTTRNDQTPQRTPVVDTPTEPVRAHSGDDTIAVDFDPRLRRNRPEPSISLHMAPSAPGTASNSPAKKTSAPEKKYKCQFCNRAFSRSEHRSRHERSRKWFPSIPLDPSLSLYFIAG